jgi:hypothetical protein
MEQMESQDLIAILLKVSHNQTLFAVETMEVQELPQEIAERTPPLIQLADFMH